MRSWSNNDVYSSSISHFAFWGTVIILQFNEVICDIVVNAERQTETKKVVNEDLNNVKAWSWGFVSTKSKPNTNNIVRNTTWKIYLMEPVLLLAHPSKKLSETK